MSKKRVSRGALLFDKGRGGFKGGVIFSEKGEF